MFRMLVGPGLSFVAGAFLIKDKAKLGSIWDLVFLGSVAATIGAALLTPEELSTQPLKPGEAAPLSRSRYITLTLALAAAWFCFAHFVAPRLL